MTAHVSVAMAVYNGREFLQEQLDSVLADLQAGDELIVVDDASTDGSEALLKRLASPCVRLFSNPSNVGQVRTFERALALARHPVVFLCDQDDVWMPGKRNAYLAAFAQHPAIKVVIADAAVIDCAGRQLAPSYMASRPGGFHAGLLNTLRSNRFLGCAMAIRRDLLKIALPIPPRVPMHDMWLGALGSFFGRVVYLPVPYQYYRRHNRNVSPAQSGPFARMLRWRARLALELLRRVLAVACGLHGSAA